MLFSNVYYTVDVVKQITRERLLRLSRNQEYTAIHNSNEGTKNNKRLMSKVATGAIDEICDLGSLLTGLGLKGVSVAKAYFMRSDFDCPWQDFHVDYGQEDDIWWTSTMVPVTVFLYLEESGLDTKPSKIKRYMLEEETVEKDAKVLRVDTKPGDVVVIRGDVEHRGIHNTSRGYMSRIVILTKVDGGPAFFKPPHDTVYIRKYN